VQKPVIEPIYPNDMQKEPDDRVEQPEPNPDKEPIIEVPKDENAENPEGGENPEQNENQEEEENN